MGERAREEKKSFRASFSFLLSFPHSFPGRSHLLEEKANFWKHSWSCCSLFSPINQHVRSLFSDTEEEGKKSKELKSEGETWLKERRRKKGSLETAVGEVSWRFPAINFSPRRLAHLKQTRAGAGPRYEKGQDPA